MDRPISKREERLLLLAVFFFWFSVYTYPSFLTSYAVNQLGATQSMAGLIVGSYGFTQMLLRIPLGIVSDIVKKRKPFVMAGLAFSVLAAAGFSFAALRAGQDHVPSWIALSALFFRGMSGITAATWVNFSVLYSSGYEGDQVAAAMSRVIVPQCGSQVIAMLLGSQLADRFGALWAFLLALSAGIVGLILLSRIQEPPIKGSPITLRGCAEVARNPQLLTGSLLAAIYQLVVWSTGLGFVQNWAKDVLLLSTAELGYLSVAQLLPNTVISRFSGTVLMRRFGRKTVVAAGFVLLAAACFWYPAAHSLLSLLSAQALLGLGVGLIMPLTMSSAIETVPDEKRGAAMGIYQAVYGLGMFFGPVLAGRVIEYFSAPLAGGTVSETGYAACFRLFFGVALLGALLSLILLGKKQGASAASRNRDKEYR